jgi:hypothetical protein
MRIHVVGASGSGTTTLGRALAKRLGCRHLDTDDVFWLPSDPPFRYVRDRGERQALLGAALRRHPGYDEGLDAPERCRKLHEQWLAALPCPVDRLMDTGSTEDHVAAIMGGPR